MGPIGINYTPPSMMIFEKVLDAIPMPGDSKSSETGQEKKDPGVLEKFGDVSGINRQKSNLSGAEA